MAIGIIGGRTTIHPCRRPPYAGVVVSARIVTRSPAGRPCCRWSEGRAWHTNLPHRACGSPRSMPRLHDFIMERLESPAVDVHPAGPQEFVQVRGNLITEAAGEDVYFPQLSEHHMPADHVSDPPRSTISTSKRARWSACCHPSIDCGSK